jgi:hypothetical protein
LALGYINAAMEARGIMQRYEEMPMMGAPLMKHTRISVNDLNVLPISELIPT